MFDIGVWELFVIGVVALIVIGPEELPRVARTTGHLLGRLRRYVSDVKSDISREMEVADFKRMHESVSESARDLQHSLSEQARELEQQFSHVASEVSQPVAEGPQQSLLPEESVSTGSSEAAQPVEVADAAEKDENQLDLFGAEPGNKARS